ncbi:MAG: hypothetical protein ACRDRZ_10180 [Pseudonocardiaceae bacterium]
MNAFGWAYTIIAVVLIAAVIDTAGDLPDAVILLAIVALPVTLVAHGVVTLRRRWGRARRQRPSGPMSRTLGGG